MLFESQQRVSISVGLLRCSAIGVSLSSGESNYLGKTQFLTFICRSLRSDLFISDLQFVCLLSIACGFQD